MAAVAWWGILALLFLAPYFRGLFFPPEQERALVVAAVCLLLVYLERWLKGKARFLEHPLDLAILAFLFVYLVSLPVAVNKGLALNEVVKNALYFAIFWSVARLVGTVDKAEKLLFAFWLSGVGVALAGLGTATGIIFIRDGFLNGRIYSSFQYPNALASFLLALLLVGTYLWYWSWKEGPRWRGFPYSSYSLALGNFLLATVFWGTKSNGGVLTLLVIAPLLLWRLPKEARLSWGLHLLQANFWGLISGLVFTCLALAGSYDAAWGVTFLGLIFSLGCQWLVDYGNYRGWPNPLARIPSLFWWVGLSVVLLVPLIVVLSHPRLERVHLWNLLHARNAIERLYFYRDALEMMATRPWLGWGGGGWQEAYRHFQHYLYNSTQVHSYYLQVGVETGVLGLLVLLAIWVLFLRSAHRLYHTASDPRQRLFIWLTTVAALAIGIHAAVDFNLSLSALALLLFSLFGVVTGLELSARHPQEEGKKARRAKAQLVRPSPAPLVLVSFFALALAALGTSLAVAGNAAWAATQALQQHNLSEARALALKAQAYNPLNADYRALLVQIYLMEQNPQAAVKEAQEVVRLSRYSEASYALLANALKQAGRYREAVEAAEKAVRHAPFRIQDYELLADTAFYGGYMELANGKKDEARFFFTKVVEVPQLIEKRMATVTPQEKRLWVVAPYLAPTPSIKVAVGGAYYFLGQGEEAQKYLTSVLPELKEDKDKMLKAQALLWLALVAEKSGDAKAAQRYAEEGKKLAPGFDQWLEQTRKLPVLR
ncbi:O-antigen polymerase [Ammonifex degensii KC4]|uniref:O-antigen polymerase n=1 Tax=Ammonifex degensii (strain DSM 10501 / KC4) TaxID=429009 RepID=C9R9W5_AMMDK|nr:O-antigen ligase family protein [Ammonifex degensii]ACX53094.1 O-antigen polymerase [Ammonifex degensii KC4]